MPDPREVMETWEMQSLRAAIAAAEAKILRYEAALWEIARPDYRGPRLREQNAAWDALKAEGIVR